MRRDNIYSITPSFTRPTRVKWYSRDNRNLSRIHSNKTNMEIIKEKKKDLGKETVRRLSGVSTEFNKSFTLRLFKNEEKYDQMIAQVGIEVMALCEHHLLPFQCTVNIAYIPSGWIMGLSKFARIVELYLNPTINTVQERATQQIMNQLKKLKPKGAMVVIKGTHS